MLTYFHGDIANNICLKQECDVLKIVGCKKEYLIKRIFVNECNVNYRKWTRKIQTLIVIDIYPFNSEMKSKFEKENRRY